MLLDAQQLMVLEESILQELPDKLSLILTRLNRAGELDKALTLWELDHLLYKNSGWNTEKNGKIVIFGDSHVKPEQLLSVAQECGISKERIECHLSYDAAKRFDPRTLQYNPDYSLVLFGPVPHSGKATGDNGSIIEGFRSLEGMPPVETMGTNELKITKSSFLIALKQALGNGFIWPD